MSDPLSQPVQGGSAVLGSLAGGTLSTVALQDFLHRAQLDVCSKPACQSTIFPCRISRFFCPWLSSVLLDLCVCCAHLPFPAGRFTSDVTSLWDPFLSLSSPC
jgi:hypothetical protein